MSSYRQQVRIIVTWLLALAVSGSAIAAPYETLVDSLMKDEKVRVRLAAAKGLARFKDAPVVAALTFALKDPDGAVRAQAAVSLSQIGDASVFQAICDLQRDTDQLVRAAADTALGAFGGAGACTAAKVFVTVEVTGDADALRKRVQDGLVGLAARNQRVTLGRTVDLTAGADSSGDPDPRAEVEAGRLKGVRLKVHLASSVARTAATTVITCEAAQSVYDLRINALRGSATQRGAIELGSGNVTDQAVAAQMAGCMDALTPVLFRGLSEYLDRLK